MPTQPSGIPSPIPTQPSDAPSLSSTIPTQPSDAPSLSSTILSSQPLGRSVELELTPITKSAKIDPVPLLLYDYARKRGYDSDLSTFINEAVVDFYKRRRLEIGQGVNAGLGINPSNSII